MFNMANIDLYDEIANKSRNQILESENYEREVKNSNRNQLLHNLSLQYNQIFESEFTKNLRFQQLTEAAVMTKLRDITYGIFESSLLIDDEPKAYYEDVIKETFNAEFGKLLAESGVKTLKEFRDKFGKSNPLYSSVLEEAIKLADVNMRTYVTILENTGDNSTYVPIRDMYKALYEADTAEDTKTQSILDAIEAVRKAIVESEVDINIYVRFGVDIKKIIHQVLSLATIGLGVKKNLLYLITFFLDRLLVAITNADRNENSLKYYNMVKNIKIGLIKLKKTLTDKAEIDRIDNQIKNCNELIDKISSNNFSINDDVDFVEKLKNKNNDKYGNNLSESTYSLLDSIEAGGDYLIGMTESSSDFVSKLTTAINSNPSMRNTKELLESIKTLTESSSVDINAVNKCLYILHEAEHHICFDFLSEDSNEQLENGEVPKPEDFYTAEDNKLLDDITNINGKNFAIKNIKDKVVQVISDEEKAAANKQKENEDMINKMRPDQLEEMKASMNESVGLSFGTSINQPETLFSAIVFNRSKKMLTEASSDSNPIMDNKDTILAESITLYTIHETFNTLNLKKFDHINTRKLMNEYYYNKI